MIKYIPVVPEMEWVNYDCNIITKTRVMHNEKRICHLNYMKQSHLVPQQIEEYGFSSNQVDIYMSVSFILLCVQTTI